MPTRAAELVRLLGLAPHPEGGFYREVYRSAHAVQPDDARPPRAALTSIDFLLVAGQCSAWHRVQSCEIWHRYEGAPLRLWLVSPALDVTTAVVLDTAAPGCSPRRVVPAGWWQAAEPLGDYVYVGATVGPGFDFADFAFGRDDAGFKAALRVDLARML